MKDIMLRIIGNQLHGLESEPADAGGMELFTEGRFAKRGDALYLTYEESELSGIEGCTTSLKVLDGKVRMKRYGGEGVQTAIEFEKGRRFSGFYQTPFGKIEMEVMTNEIENRLDPEGGAGTLGIDCSVSLKGLTESRNMLRFEVM